MLETLNIGLNEALILVATRASNIPVGYQLLGMVEVIGGMAGDMSRKHRPAAPMGGAGRSTS